MTTTIKRLCETVIDLAGKIRAEAEDVGQEGVAVAEAVIGLCDAQRALNRVHDSLRLAKAQAADGKAEPELRAKNE